VVEAFGLVIEAPSSFGKTTVMQDYLRKILPKGTNWIQHVCAGKLAPLRRIAPLTPLSL
jgi:hypothetical protein